jgi:hypothetical protein
MGFANAQHQYWKPMEILKLALLSQFEKLSRFKSAALQACG